MDETKSKLLLRGPENYLQWKLWLTCVQKTYDTKDHLKEYKVPTDKEEKKVYMLSEAKLMAKIFETIHSKYVSLISHCTNVHAIMEQLNKIYCEAKFDELETITKKLENIRYMSDRTKLFTYIRSLITRYKNLGGSFGDHNLARFVVRMFPDDLTFSPVKLLLKEEAKKNKNKYVLENVLTKLDNAMATVKHKRQYNNKNDDVQHSSMY